MEMYIEQGVSRKDCELKIAEKYLEEFGKMAKVGNTIVLPATLSDVGGMITLAKGLLEGGKQEDPAKRNHRY